MNITEYSWHNNETENRFKAIIIDNETHLIVLAKTLNTNCFRVKIFTEQNYPSKFGLFKNYKNILMNSNASTLFSNGTDSYVSNIPFVYEDANFKFETSIENFNKLDDDFYSIIEKIIKKQIVDNFDKIQQSFSATEYDFATCRKTPTAIKNVMTQIEKLTLTDYDEVCKNPQMKQLCNFIEMIRKSYSNHIENIVTKVKKEIDFIGRIENYLTLEYSHPIISIDENCNIISISSHYDVEITFKNIKELENELIKIDFGKYHYMLFEYRKYCNKDTVSKHFEKFKEINENFTYENIAKLFSCETNNNHIIYDENDGCDSAKQFVIDELETYYNNRPIMSDCYAN